ncbi:STAS domain-containing protein [Plesiocystis pacifica]|nr:STAS domain-containing protein [Plesiocystis pacifica]
MPSLEHVPAWVWLASDAGDFIQSSAYVHALTGGPDRAPANWFAALGPAEAARFRGELAACRRAGAPLRRFRHTLALGDGAPIEVETDCSARELADGAAVLAGVTREAPPRSTAAENALVYLNELPILLAVTDDRGTTELVNKTVLDPLRLTPESVRGVPFDALPCWVHDPGVQARIREAIVEASEGRGVVVELEARFAGSTLPMKYTCDPLFDDEGEVSTLLHTGTPLVEQRRIRTELQRKLEIIERQAQAIRVMSTPVLQVWEGVFVIPIIGTFDAARSEALMEATLGHVSASASRFAILDLTGVDAIDDNIADHLRRVVNSARLVGATCVLTGLSPTIAQTLAGLDVDRSKVVTLRNLESGLRYCLRALATRESSQENQT